MIAKAFRSSTSIPIGVQLWVSPDKSRLVIVHLDENCIFPKSELKIGMQVVSINGENCIGKDLAVIMNKLNAINGSITLITAAPQQSLTLSLSTSVPQHRSPRKNSCFIKYRMPGKVVPDLKHDDDDTDSCTSHFSALDLTMDECKTEADFFESSNPVVDYGYGSLTESSPSRRRHQRVRWARIRSRYEET